MRFFSLVWGKKSIANQIRVFFHNYHSNIRMHGSYMLCREKRTEGISLVNSLAWLVETPVGKSMKAFPALFVYSFLVPFLITSSTPDTITPNQSIIDGETLVTAGGNFELGFFSPGKLKSRYVGIWYVVSKGTVVWVANRETPLENHSGVLKVTDKGILVLLDSTANTTVWSSNNTPSTAGNKINRLRAG